MATRESLICGPMEAYLWGRAGLLRSILVHISHSNKPPLVVAVRCSIGLSKPISLLVVAHRFWVLRSEWCQQWCQVSSDPCACNTVGCVEDLQTWVLVSPQRQTARSSRPSRGYT